MSSKLKTSLYILLVVSLTFVNPVNAEDISIELISDISLIDDCVEGECGGPIDPPRTYLFEGEQIVFDVQIYSSQGISNIAWVYVTANGKVEVECKRDEIIDNEHVNYLCTLTVEIPDSMHGESLIKAEVKSINGNHDETEIGSWFLNAAIDLNPQTTTIIFPNPSLGERVYSKPIIVTSNVEQGSNVPLTMYISGTHIYDSYGNLINLSNLAYYTKNGDYNTLNDPRADSEGYVPLMYGDQFTRNFFNNAEIIQVPGINWKLYERHYKPGTYPENILETDDEMILTFRLDSPLTYSGYFNIVNVYVWGAADGWGPSAGRSLNFNLTVLENDIDKDGVFDIYDKCFGTEEGVEVDVYGCSAEQFCNKVVINRKDNKKMCKDADWKDNEKKNPKDCKEKRNSKKRKVECIATRWID